MERERKFSGFQIIGLGIWLDHVTCVRFINVYIYI